MSGENLSLKRDNVWAKPNDMASLSSRARKLTERAAQLARRKQGHNPEERRLKLKPERNHVRPKKFASDRD